MTGHGHTAQGSDSRAYSSNLPSRESKDLTSSGGHEGGHETRGTSSVEVSLLDQTTLIKRQPLPGLCCNFLFLPVHWFIGKGVKLFQWDSYACHTRCRIRTDCWAMRHF